jgi:putative glycosyltransferase (TIGR04372 family)
MVGPLKRAATAAFRVAACGAFVTVSLPILWLIEPFWRIRLGEFLEDRIGHLAANTEFYVRLSERDGWPRRTTALWFAWNPANRQLLDMWKRRLNVIESLWLRRIFIAVRPILARTRFCAMLPMIPYDWHEVMFTGRPALRFTAAEEEQGRRQLAAIGIGPTDWFVCFHARDRAYLSTREGFGEKRHTDYLDSSIDNYIPAMQWIASLGGYAVRVGAAVHAPLPDLGARIIDYATHHRSDFMDIYLPAKCRFFLGTNSGFYNAALIFNVPVALTNMCPFPFVGMGGTNIMDIFKLLRSAKLQRILTLPEINDMGLLECYRNEPVRLRKLFNGTTYDKLGLQWVENEAQDILGLCMDMMDRIEGRAPSEEAVRLQAAFRALYRQAPDSRHLGGIGPRFALRYAHLIEPHKHGSADARPLRETA